MPQRPRPRSPLGDAADNRTAKTARALQARRAWPTLGDMQRAADQAWGVRPPTPRPRSDLLKLKALRVSAKTRCITLSGILGGLDFRLTGTPQAMADAYHRLTGAAPRQLESELERTILTALLEHGGKKARGVQARRQDFLRLIKHAAARAYVFVGQELKRPSAKRPPALRAAEQEVARRIPEIAGYPNFDRRVFLTATLLLATWGRAWEALGLKDPLAATAAGEYSGESFYRTYIQPRLKAVRALARRAPDRFRPDAPELHPHLRLLLA